MSAGVHAHRAADRTGDADRPLEAPDTGGGEPAGDDRQAGGAADADRDHAVGLRSDLERRQARSGHDDQAGEAGVGDQQVRALADDQQQEAAIHPARPAPRARGDACQDLRIVDVHEPAGRSAHAVGAQRAERRVAEQREAGDRDPARAHPAPPSERGEEVIGQRRQVAGAERDAEVAGPQLGHEVGDEVGPARHVADRGGRMGGLHGLGDQAAADAGHRRLARGVDVGDDEVVGVDEGVGEVGPQAGDAAVAVRLEHGHDPAPAAGPHGRQGGGALAGEVGIVVDAGHPGGVAAELQAPGHAGVAGEGPLGGGEIGAGLEGEGRRRGGVGGVVGTRHRQLDAAQRLAAAQQVERRCRPARARGRRGGSRPRATGRRCAPRDPRPGPRRRARRPTAGRCRPPSGPRCRRRSGRRRPAAR